MIQNAETQLPQQSSTFVRPNEDQSQTVSNDVCNNTINISPFLYSETNQNPISIDEDKENTPEQGKYCNQTAI